MKNKEFCLSDKISLLEGAFDSDNGNFVIKKQPKNWFHSVTQVLNSTAELLWFLPKMVNIDLLMHLLPICSKAFQSHSIAMTEKVLRMHSSTKLCSWKDRLTLCAIFAVSHLAWSLMIGRILLNKHMVEP